MTLSLRGIIESMDRREMQALAKKFLTVDMLPMSDIMRWLEQRWQPDASILLQPGSVTTSSLAPVPHVAVRRNAVQAIANASFTATEELSWDTADNPNLEMWTAGTGVRIPIPGLYQVNAMTSWPAAGAASYRLTAIHKNGVELPSRRGQFRANNFDISNNTSLCLRFATGDVLTARCFQDSGVALNTQGSMDVTWVGN